MSAPLDDDQIRSLLDRLDPLVPRTGAVVMLDIYGGGPDETQVVANRLGYLRLGIEVMRAAYLPAGTSGEPTDIHPEIEYLWHAESTVVPSWFQRTEHLPARSIPPVSALSHIIPWLIVGAIIATLAFAAIGFVAVLRWAV